MALRDALREGILHFGDINFRVLVFRFVDLRREALARNCSVLF